MPNSEKTTHDRSTRLSKFGAAVPAVLLAFTLACTHRKGARLTAPMPW